MCHMDYEERSKKIYQVDMTAGSLIKNVLCFVFPICLGNILQQLYGIVDTLVIGKFCGANSLAAVGTSTKPVEILLCVFLGICQCNSADGTGSFLRDCNFKIYESTGRCLWGSYFLY